MVRRRHGRVGQLVPHFRGPCHSSIHPLLLATPTAGLDKNAHDRAKCKGAFDEYKECRGAALEAARRERAASHKGFFS